MNLPKMTLMKGFITLALGLGLMLCGIKLAAYNGALMLFGNQTLAKIESFEEVQANEQTLYAAEAAFEVEGVEFSTTSQTFVSNRKFRSHDYVLVTYLPRNPSYSRFSSEVKIDSSAYSLMGAGSLLLVFGAGFIFRGLKRNRILIQS